MAYIFLDESGDLGFKKTSSKWFIFTIAIVSHPRLLERVVKKVWRSLKKKHKALGELHAVHEKDITRKRMLKALSELPDLKIICIILNKKKAPRFNEAPSGTPTREVLLLGLRVAWEISLCQIDINTIKKPFSRTHAEAGEECYILQISDLQRGRFSLDHSIIPPCTLKASTPF